MEKEVNMKVNAINCVGVNKMNFKAVLGETEIERFHGSGVDSKKITLHVYPFKDEIINGTDKDKKAIEMIETYKLINDEELPENLSVQKSGASYFVANNKANSQFSADKYEVKFEQPLPFNQVAFKSPNLYADNSTRTSIADFVNNKLGRTLIKDTGYVDHMSYVA